MKQNTSLTAANFIKDKTALITGASGGIGRSIALMLARSGGHCVLIARGEAKLNDVATEIRKYNVKAFVYKADASDQQAVQTVYNDLKQKGITIDILVNNVGVGKYGNLEHHSTADYDWMMNTNMRSTFLWTHFFLPAMMKREDGDLVFIGSVAGLKGLPGEAVYCASKSAQVAFAHSIDYECRKKNVRVHVIAPGGVRTDFAMGTGREPGMPVLDKMLAAEDIAKTVHFVLNQRKQLRYFVLGMRPLSEPL
ncbi:hypothetical protein COTS27_01644 [Spirochaetota bacterium]|nr:hypothetical protein COTS27_01644 [Spirochaetota bacterium]